MLIYTHGEAIQELTMEQYSEHCTLVVDKHDKSINLINEMVHVTSGHIMLTLNMIQAHAQGMFMLIFACLNASHVGIYSKMLRSLTKV